uniref:RH1 domain-containing protein n=1 Tax=Ciona savignyi TaxID=51511 RepID=H2ZKU4_CIOSA
QVQAMANSVYGEFKRMMAMYGEDVIKELMPLIVTILETLDRSLSECNANSVEVELLKDDNEQLATQYERERQLRRQAEQQLMESEDINEAATREVRAKADTLETATRLLELKCKNYTDQVERLQEREAELKREYTVLHERHTEMIQSYMEHIEKTKVLQQQSSFSELSQSPNKYDELPKSISITPSSPSSPDDKSQLTSSEEHHPAEVMGHKEEIKTETKPNNSQMDIGKSSLEHVKSQSSTPEVYSSQIKPSETDSSRENTKSHSVAKLAEAHLLSASNINTNVSVDRSQATVKGLLFKVCFTRIWSDQIERFFCSHNFNYTLNAMFNLIYSTGIENVAFETNESSLYAELSKHDLGDVDEGADILVKDLPPKGMSKEVENLLHENTKLLATKNALNVVKDDLIQQVDQLTTQHTILKEELETSEKAKQKLQVRMGEFEQQLAQLQHELENVGKDGMRNSVSKQSDEDDAVPLSQRKRFTRVEMARVLMERNQYKERLMELQEAVRWTETLRASRNHPEVPQPKIKSKSNIFNFFSRLFTSNSSENAAPSPQPPQVDPYTIRHGRRLPNSSNELNVSMAYNAPSSKVMPRSKSTSMSFSKDTVRYQTRMNDNSRIQACGWSLPNSPASPKEGSRTVPVPVYCGPMVDSNANMKVWCATAVNMAVGRTRDGGSIIATSSIFYEGKELGTVVENEVMGDGNEKETQTIKQDEKRREALSSLVWIVSGDTRSGNGAHGGSKVRVMDAQEPNKCIEEFIIGNNDTHVLCMASVPVAFATSANLPHLKLVFITSKYKFTSKFRQNSTTQVHWRKIIRCPTHLKRTPCTARSSMLGMTQSPTDVDPPSTRTQEDGVEATEDLVSSDPTNLPKSIEMVKTPTGEKGEFPPSDQNGGGDMAPSKDDNPPSSTDDMKLASVQPTVWMGAQNGCVYVHSAISHWGRCLHQIRLKDSVLSIVHLKGRVLAALADGTVAIFRRDTDGVWDLSSYYLLDLGRPHHSIRCMSVVYDHVWCGYRNRIHIVEPKSMKVVKSFDAHPRRESQVRQLAWGGDGVWVSIRLDSTVRLYHARTLQHLQDVDIEPYVSKVLGSGKLGFSFVRITALMISQNRLWIGTGNGVVMSVPLSEVPIIISAQGARSSQSSNAVLSSSARGAERPGGVVRVYKDPLSDKITPGTFIPYCSMANAQLSFHGYRDAVKFFVAVPGSVLLKELGLIATINTQCCVTQPSNANDPGGVSPPKSHPNNGTLVLSGGDGYVDFRKGDLVAFSPEETRSSNAGMQSTTQMSHVIVWQLTHQ